MRSARTISCYVAVEIFQYTVLAFLAAAPVILLPNAFDQLGDFIVIGVTARDVFVVLGWVFVLVSGYALPIAFIFGLLLAIGRLQSDHEIVAMRSCGMGAATLAIPVVLVGTLLSLLTAAVSIGLEHRAWKQIGSTKRQVLSRGAVIEPGRFARFGKRMILADSRIDQHHFRNVVISDHTTEEKPMLIFAETAEYSFEPSTGTVRLVLGPGDLRVDLLSNDDFQEHRITFSRFTYSFRAPWLAGDSWRFSPKQLSFSELREAGSGHASAEMVERLKYRKARHYASHMHRMLAIPITPLLFAMIGVPLATLGFVRSRARGLLMALMLLAGYYGVFLFAYSTARSGLVAPALAVWSPNAAFLAVAIFLLRRTFRAPL